MRAAVDVMGGDKAPAAILKGCWEAAPLLGKEDFVILLGEESICTAALAESGLTPEQKKHYKIVPTTQNIEMDDSPVEAVRTKRDSGIVRMAADAGKKSVDAVISAGNAT